MNNHVVNRLFAEGVNFVVFSVTGTLHHRSHWCVRVSSGQCVFHRIMGRMASKMSQSALQGCTPLGLVAAVAVVLAVLFFLLYSHGRWYYSVFVGYSTYS